MTVRGYLTLLVGVFVVALLAVTLIGRDLVGDLGGAAREAAGSSGPRARTAGELRAAYLSEQRDLARFLATADPADASGSSRPATASDGGGPSWSGPGWPSPSRPPWPRSTGCWPPQQAAADRATALRRSGRTAEARRVAEREVDPAGPRPGGAAR
jgi:hypothetical protein